MGKRSSKRFAFRERAIIAPTTTPLNVLGLQAALGMPAALRDAGALAAVPGGQGAGRADGAGRRRDQPGVLPALRLRRERSASRTPYRKMRLLSPSGGPATIRCDREQEYEAAVSEKPASILV